MESDLISLEIGMEMETIAYTLFQNEERQDVVTWAFRTVNQ